MIEIDDRVVMLLFILFLGYMLFNRREGFNVGGEEDSSTEGYCDCTTFDNNGSCVWKPTSGWKNDTWDRKICTGGGHISEKDCNEAVGGKNLSGACKWYSNPPNVTCDCKIIEKPNINHPDTFFCLGDSKAGRMMIPRTDCTKETTVISCKDRIGTLGPVAVPMCKVTDISNTACDDITDKNLCNRKLDDNYKNSCFWCTKQGVNGRCTTLEEAKKLIEAPDFFKCSNLDNTAN